MLKIIIMTLHELVQKRIVEVCDSMGLQTQAEYRGKDWRADVYVEKSTSIRYAFEIQISPQSLKKTQERQAKYIRDGIIGCWLFEKEPTKQILEKEDLPIFKLVTEGNEIFVSLKKRKILPINVFIKDFIQGKIRFCHTLKPLPKTEILFVRMDCWKCGATNHIYFVGSWHSSCNIKIWPEETMWASDKISFHPCILNKVRSYAESERGKHLNLATVKERYSKTIGDSYMSFGCSRCNSIFGDWYVRGEFLDVMYGRGIVDKFTFDMDMDLEICLKIPHWCHPGEHDFCEKEGEIHSNITQTYEIGDNLYGYDW